MIDGQGKERLLVPLHWAMTIGLAYLVIFSSPGPVGLGAGLSVVLSFASNLVLMRLPKAAVHHPTFDLLLVVSDVVIVTVALLSCGSCGAEFFFMFFFVVFLSALGERPELTAVAAALAAGAYLVVLHYDALWQPALLLRVPFFFVTSLTYAYLASTARAARAHARAADEMLAAKAHFLSMMSHEIQNPLHVILWYGDLLGAEWSGNLSTTQREAVAKITTYASELQDLISHTLLAARLESGRLPVHVQEFTMGPLLEELQLGLSAYTKTTVALVVRAAHGLPPLVTDRLKLKEILTNLVTNALKYTAEGSVEVTVRGPERGDVIEIVVQDTGVGIPRDAQPAIFDLFTRAPDADASGAAGVGLGLYIVRRLLDLLHGEIGLVSEPGVGSTFTVRVPRCLRAEALAA